MHPPQSVLIDLREGRATLTLNRPDSLNALTVEMLERLADALDGIASDPSIRVVVLTGAGRAFAAGVDLKALAVAGVDLSAGDVGSALNAQARRVIDAIASMPQPVIARVNGFCFTGALEIVLACDLVIVAEDARLGDTHAMLGLRPTWGMSQRLARAVGSQRARELSFTARHFSGREAAQYGLALEAVAPGALDEAVERLVERIVKNSAGSLAAYKDLYRAAADHGLADGLAYEMRATYPITDAGARIDAFLKR